MNLEAKLIITAIIDDAGSKSPKAEAQRKILLAFAEEMTRLFDQEKALVEELNKLRRQYDEVRKALRDAERHEQPPVPKSKRRGRGSDGRST
jgi:anion-transporting  ArsA/GET3 family ATPase